MEQTLTPEESLQIIQKSISNSRKNMREGASYYVLWGWALILASLANYTVLRYYLKAENYTGLWWKSLGIWLAFIGIAFIWQTVKGARAHREAMVKTNLDRYIATLWGSSGIIMLLMVFFAFKVDTYPTPFILAITGLATFVSGMMVRYIALILGGIVFLAASVVAIYVSGLEQLLVVAVAMVLGYLIPGYMLRNLTDGQHV